MVKTTTKLLAHDESIETWATEYEVSPEGQIAVRLFCGTDCRGAVTLNPADSTALVEFLGPKVKQVR